MVGSELGAFVGGKVGRTVEALVDVKAVTVELNVKPLQASTVITSVTLADCPTASDIGAPSRFVPCWPTTALIYSLGKACMFVTAYVIVKGKSAQVLRLQNDSGRKRRSSSQTCTF